MKMLKTEKIRIQNSTTIIEMFFKRDPEEIKSFISFVEENFCVTQKTKKDPVGQEMSDLALRSLC